VDAQTLSQCVEGFIEAAEVRGVMVSTAARYRRVGRQLLEVLGRRRSPRLTNGDVMAYVKARREAGVSGRTISSELSLLRTFLRGTVGPAAITWAAPRLYDPDQEAPKPIPRDWAVADLLQVLRPKPPWHRAALIALLTALRPADVLRLGPQHLNRNERGWPFLVVPMQKRRGAEVVIPVVETLFRELEPVTSGLYGPTVTGVASFGSALRHHTKALQKPWNGVKILRSVAATWASEEGFTDAEVGILLGHTVPSMARKHYIRPAADPWMVLRRRMFEAVEARLELADAELENFKKHTPPSHRQLTEDP
jgi:integrase